MPKKSGEYGDQSISALKGPDRVRKRPGVIFGSDGIEGCEHSFFEILSNSIDEAREGYGNVINITVRKDKSITVEDFGRGVPLDWNEKEQRYNWDLIYCELYAGSKYNNDGGEAYTYSLGLNGLGACATQYCSEYMHVTSYTKQGKYTINFEKGYPVSDLGHDEPVKRRTGTVVEWKPDISVFTDINIPLEYFEDVLHKQAIVNAGLKLVLNYENPDGSHTKKEYLYKRGIVDYVNELISVAGEGSENSLNKTADENDVENADETQDVSETETQGEKENAENDENDASRTLAITTPAYFRTERRGRDREDKPEYTLKVEMVFCFSNIVNRIEYYHNSSFLEHGGSPDKAFKSAFVKAFDKYLKDNNKYSKNESKITYGDIEDCLIFIVNSHSTYTSYENQTKKAITNTFITEAMTEFFLHSLEVFFAENPAQAEKCAAQVLINKRSRENAESTRVNIKKKLSSNIDIINRVEKFVGCRSKDAAKRELYIVEGDSAMSSCKLARDPDYQAIMPVRGKTLNCLKCGYDRIFKSDIIVDLLKVVGCGVEMGKSKSKNLADFDPDALKWSKIIICTDADEDGYQIRTLILTMFYRLLPTLIQMGKVYIAESPLYEITSKSKGIQFAYNEAEKAKILEGIGNEKYTIQRSKGLGENEPDMMNKTTMNPASRRLIRINPTDEQATYIMFNTLLGDDLDARKEYIAKNGAQYIDLADV